MAAKSPLMVPSLVEAEAKRFAGFDEFDSRQWVRLEQIKLCSGDPRNCPFVEEEGIPICFKAVPILHRLGRKAANDSIEHHSQSRIWILTSCPLQRDDPQREQSLELQLGP